MSAIQRSSSLSSAVREFRSPREQRKICTLELKAAKNRRPHCSYRTSNGVAQSTCQCPSSLGSDSPVCSPKPSAATSGSRQQTPALANVELKHNANKILNSKFLDCKLEFKLGCNLPKAESPGVPLVRLQQPVPLHLLAVAYVRTVSTVLHRLCCK